MALKAEAAAHGSAALTPEEAPLARKPVLRAQSTPVLVSPPASASAQHVLQRWQLLRSRSSLSGGDAAANMDAEHRLRVLLVVPAGLPRLAQLLAPISVLSRRCTVHTVAASARRSAAGPVAVRADYSFADAPPEADVVVVLGALRRAQLAPWLARFRSCPFVARIRGARVTLFSNVSGSDGEAVKLAARTDVDASLDLLDVLYAEHDKRQCVLSASDASLLAPEPASAGSAGSAGSGDSGASSVGSSCPGDASSVGSSCPGDMAAEDLGFFRHHFCPDLDRFTASDHLWQLAGSLRGLLRQKFIAVAVFSGVDDIGLASVMDVWSHVAGARVVLLAATYSKPRQSASPQSASEPSIASSASSASPPSPPRRRRTRSRELVHDGSVEAEVLTAGGVRLAGVRALSNFAQFPLAAQSVDVLLVPPAGNVNGGASRAQPPSPDALLKALGARDGCAVWDQRLVQPADAVAHQLELVQKTFGRSAARAAVHALRIR